MVDEWTTVEVALKIPMIQKLEQVTKQKIDDIIEKLVEREYHLKCTYIPVVNHCFECGHEVKLFLPPNTRKKTTAWMKKADVFCSNCMPKSKWQRVR